MRRMLFTMLAAVLVLAGGCGPVQEQPPVQTVPVNPQEAASNMEKVPVTLYYAYKDEFLLAGEPRVIEAPVNGRLETAVLKELIKGPSPGNRNLQALLPPGVQAVSVSEEGEYLFVTLNNEFLKQATTVPPEEGREKLRLGVYSVVNTLAELGGFARVQLFVDVEENGLGQRIKKSDAGFDGEGDLEPLGFMDGIVLNPRNTVAEFLKAYANKDYERMYEFIAYHGHTGEERPLEEDFLSGVVSFNSGLSDYRVIDYYASADNATAVALLDFRVETQSGQASEQMGVLLKLVKEENIWRISYDSFVKAFNI